MDHVIPRPPLLGRPPQVVWTALTCCAAALFAFALFATNPATFGPDGIGHEGRLVFLSADARLGIVLALALPILFARRAPVSVLAVLLAEGVVLRCVGMRMVAMLPATAVLLGVIAAVRRRTVSLAAAGAVAGLWVADCASEYGGNTRVSDVVSMSGTGLTALTLAWVSGYAVRLRRDYTDKLRSHTAAQAVAAERLRIARELHDMVAHSIGVIAFQAGAARRVIDTQPEGARDALGAIEDTSRETLAGLRRMLGALRRADGGPGDAVPAAGLDDLGRLTATAAEAGVRVDVAWHGERRPLPPEIDLSAFRIIQESVTNVMRHAGTDACRVGIRYDDDAIAVEVQDDGRGNRTEANTDTGYGIQGMRERVSLLGGRFSAGTRPEGGFHVTARLPA